MNKCSFCSITLNELNVSSKFVNLKLAGFCPVMVRTGCVLTNNSRNKLKMCGIFGVVNYEINKDKAMFCLSKLEHRGPDGSGLYQDDMVTLGHRRLAILDLSENGKQPMSYMNERYWITYNGEIYNFVEIRNQLIALGYHFVSDCDTEVILAAYVEWKEDCLKHFNGMWAFVIYDKEDRKLFISRDRYGVKPLYYAYIGDSGLVFASEMKAMIPVLDNVRANKLLFDIFRAEYHYEMREDCLLEGVYRFPAASYAYIDINCLSNKRICTKEFWCTMDHLIDLPDDYNEQVELFRELFLDACKLRMRSDVAMGTALSGGVDSTATICSMKHLADNDRDKRMCKDYQHAYVAAFPGTPLDESAYAKMVTDYLGINATFLEIKSDFNEQELLKSIYLFEELWNNPQIPMMRLYGEEKKSGTTVSLDGHGADELFCGYEFDIIKAIPSARKKADTKEIYKTWKNAHGSYGDYDEKSLKFLIEMKKSEGFQYIRFFKNQIMGARWQPSWYKQNINWKKLDSLNKDLYVTTHNGVLPTMLRNYDRNSMANSVEIRMPFMDYRVVSFAFSIGWNSKIRDGFSKKIIRDAIAPYAPKNVVYRRDKIGFNAPLMNWLKDEGVKEFFQDTVMSTGYANCSLIDNVKKCRKRAENYYKIENPTLDDAMALWIDIQPFLWEKAIIKV